MERSGQLAATGYSMSRRNRRLLLVVATLLTLGGAAGAQEVGTIAALEGAAEIGRAGSWTPAAIGAAIQQGDELRTHHPGRMRIVFQDDSVLTVSDESQVVVDEQVFNPAAGQVRSVFGLLQGKVSALVGEYYHRAGTEYQIKTATAVAGVRGTEFVVAYQSDNDVTEVAGVSGRAEVHSILDPTGHGVLVSAHELTTVARGEFPESPRRVSDAIFRRYIEGIEFIGAGGAENITTGQPLLTGASVPKPDQAGAVSGAAVPPMARDILRERRDVSSLLQQTPAVFGPAGRLRVTF